MKIRCMCCGRKFETETDDKGIPKSHMCDNCKSKAEERNKFSEDCGKGKKKRSWWRK